jgi:uncharacterized membrane protein SpoIIM required for sporulation
VLRRSWPSIVLVLVSVIGAVLVGWMFANRFRLPPQALVLDTLSKESFNSLSTTSWLRSFTPLGVLENNVRSLTGAALVGLFSFGSLAILLLMVPMAIIAYMGFQVAWAGYNPLVFLLAFVMPHGVIELPAAVLATALGVRLGAALIAPPRGMTVWDGWIQAVADFTRLFVAVVIPLLAVAAWVEVYVTPRVVLAVYAR